MLNAKVGIIIFIREKIIFSDCIACFPFNNVETKLTRQECLIKFESIL